MPKKWTAIIMLLILMAIMASVFLQFIVGMLKTVLLMGLGLFICYKLLRMALEGDNDTKR
jgi:hypothetical protein